MQGKVIAILETRTGAHLAEMIARRGGIPLPAPALAEVPDIDPQAVTDMLTAWRVNPFAVVIFQTGVGTRALFQTTDSLGLTSDFLNFLAKAVVVVRGPKPVGELNSRAVRIDVRAPSPFTTETVVEALSSLSLQGRRILVQRYGATNDRLRQALEERGAAVAEITTYRWSLPADRGPLENLLRALTARQVHAVVFTSAVQVHNLYAIAEQAGQGALLAGLLAGVVVASIGPVCSRTLGEYGIKPTFEADPPKLGPLLTGLEHALCKAP